MNKAFRLSLALHIIVSLLSASAAQAESAQELLKLVRDAHRAARESIQTFSCQVEFTITHFQELKPPITQPCSSRYWFSPQDMRAKISEFHNKKIDLLWENSLQKLIVRQVVGGQQTVSAGRRRYAHRYVMRCDPFVRGLLVLNIPNTGADFLPFEELAERAAKLKKIERKQVGNKELIMVQLFFDSSVKNEVRANVDIYFDPNVNYLIRKVVYTFPTHWWEDEVLEFKEHGPGLFFPEQLAGSSRKLPSKTRTTDSKTKFSDVQINRPLPKDIFNFKYPHGIILRDDIRGSEYKIDAEGNPISKETPFGHDPLPPDKNVEELVPGTETKEEPRPMSRWILPISFGILIAGGIAAFVRWRRRQAEST